MNTAIEMHDSECLEVEIDEQGNGFVLLDAYVHRTDGNPGISSGQGGIQRIRIKVAHITIEGNVGALPATVYEGSVALKESVQRNIIPLPASSAEKFELEMMLAEDARIIVVAGTGVSIEAEGDFRFVEPFDPS
jgi:hypothetical protein